jgi:hypothetical protein
MSDSASVPRPTTDSGVPIASDRHSLTVGPKGPTVLHDVVQKMQHFNRDRVLERVVHAKGSGAQRRKPDAASPPRWSAIPGLGRPPLGHPPRRSRPERHGAEAVG